MKKIYEDDLNELLHWLAYNFPGVYRSWTDEKNQQQMLKNITSVDEKRFRKR